MNGDVIGIISFTLIKGQNLNFAENISNLSLLPLINSSIFPKKVKNTEQTILSDFTLREFQRFDFNLSPTYIKYYTKDQINSLIQKSDDLINSRANSYDKSKSITTLNYKTKLCEFNSTMRYLFINNKLSEIQFDPDCLASTWRYLGKPNSCTEQTLREFIELKNILTAIFQSQPLFSTCQICTTKQIKIPQKYDDGFKEDLITLSENYPDNCTIGLNWIDYINNATYLLLYDVSTGWGLSVTNRNK